jgi:O-methyltransferase
VPKPPFRKRLARNLRRCILLSIAPIYLWPYFSSESGAEYGIGFFRKLRLLWLMYRNRFRIVTASGFLDQVVMVTDILRVPKDVRGVVVECGSYQGGSTTNFSLVSAMVGRELHVFDSFAGLPEPSAADKLHKVPSLLEIRTFSKGSWCGTLETVTENVRRYGDLSVCRFHQGYFDQTLPQFKEPVVFGFCDVDLRASLEPCVENLWPLLRDRGQLFTHEANHMEIAGLFFEPDWWQSRGLERVPPGLVGGGSGIGLYVSDKGFFRSTLGFAIKNLQVEDLAA